MATTPWVETLASDGSYAWEDGTGGGAPGAPNIPIIDAVPTGLSPRPVTGSGQANATLQMELDGQDAGSLVVPSTGLWQTSLSLSPGVRSLRARQVVEGVASLWSPSRTFAVFAPVAVGTISAGTNSATMTGTATMLAELTATATLENSTPAVTSTASVFVDAGGGFTLVLPNLAPGRWGVSFVQEFDGYTLASTVPVTVVVTGAPAQPPGLPGTPVFASGPAPTNRALCTFVVAADCAPCQ